MSSDVAFGCLVYSSFIWVPLLTFIAARRYGIRVRLGITAAVGVVWLVVAGAVVVIIAGAE